MASDSFIRPDTEKHRIQMFAFIIAAGLCVLFSLGFTTFGFSKRLRQPDKCEIRLDRQVNPNDAPVASLVRLPGIGPGRAAAIVTYRENFAKRNGVGPAFKNYDDLRKVKGIGPKTVQNIREWLKFE